MDNERRAQTGRGVVISVRDRLRTALEGAPTPIACSYAFLMHPRRRLGEHGFGVITLAGESLPLSVEMLGALERVPSLVDGLTPVTLGPAEPLDWKAPREAGTPWQEILPVTRVALWYGDHRQASRPIRSTGSILVAWQSGPQLVVFCATRPEGWPA